MSKRISVYLWLLCILGQWSVLPYLRYAGILSTSADLPQVLLMVTLQAALVYGVVCWLSYKLVPHTDLQPFAVTSPLQQIVYPGVLAGVAVGLFLYAVETMVFDRSALAGMHPPLWTGALASLYGGINEEVLLRLFLFTFIYFLMTKMLTLTSGNRPYLLWTTNILVALLFGLGHLPVLFELGLPSLFEVFRILLLNGIAGLVFGWLYWSRGLWAAMTAHFVTDLMIHALLI